MHALRKGKSLNSLNMRRLLPHLLLIQIQPTPLNILPKILAINLHLAHHNRMRLSRRQLLAEKAIHALQRHALRLGEQKPHKHNRAHHQTRKQQIHPVPHRREHLRREARHDEVEEPVRRCGECLPERAHVLREHLRVVHPRRSVPRGRVEDGPQVEEDHG